MQQKEIKRLTVRLRLESIFHSLSCVLCNYHSITHPAFLAPYFTPPPSLPHVAKHPSRSLP